MQNRASPGTGYIRHRTLPNGDSRFDILVREGGPQTTLKGGLRSRGEADAYLAAWYVKRNAEGHYVPTDTGITTTRKLGVLYRATLAKEKLVTVNTLWGSRIEPAEFIDWPLTQLSDQAVRRWVDKMARTPIVSGKNAGQKPQRQTLQNALNCLRRALQWGVIRGLIDRNVAKGVSISDSTMEVVSSGGDDFDYLHVDEVQRIFDAPNLPQQMRVAYTLLVFTGARPKDLYLLEWQRFDIVGRTILFRSYKKGRDYLAHLLPPALDAITEWWKVCGKPRVGLVFSCDGEPHTKGYDWGWARTRGERKWKRFNRAGVLRTYVSRKGVATSPGWKEKIGIARPIALYGLRHTCASQLLLGADLFTGGRIWSLPEIASHLGHQDTKTVERYAKALGVASKRAVEESRVALARLKKRK